MTAFTRLLKNFVTLRKNFHAVIGEQYCHQ